MRKSYLIFLVLISFLNFNRLNAGHGMALISPSFTVGATALTFTASSDAATCGGGPYWLQVELRCTAGQLTGTPPSTMQTNLLNWAGPGVTYNSFPWYNSLLNVPNYTSASAWPDQCTVEPYHPVTIPFTGLCPGQTYYFSAREWVSGTNSVGPWTTPSQFTVPGTFVPLNFNIVATPTIFCAPGSATLSVNSITGGCGQYSTVWSPGGSTLSTIVVSPAATTTYTALVSTPCNTLTKVVTINVVPSVSAAFTPVNSSTCTGSTVQFNHTGTAGVTHTWSSSPATGVTISTVNSASPSITFANPGTYVISHTVAAGSCTNVVTTNITVSGTPVTFSTPNYTQCLQGNSFTFSSSSATGTHTYAFNPGSGAPATGNTATYGPVSFTSPGTYTVTYSNNNGGCIASTSSVIVIRPQPTVTATNNGPICVGGNATFTGGGGGTYSWTGPNAFSSTLQNPGITNVTTANAGVYTLSVNLNGCGGTATTNLVISSATASANNTGPYCAGATIQLNGTAGSTYTWSGPGGFTSSVQNPTIANSTTAMSGNYTFTVNTGGCTATSSTSVTVNPRPVPAATNTGPYCAGSTIQLNVGAFTTYTWSGPSSFSSNSQNPTVTNSQIGNGGVYTVSVTGTGGCVGTSTTNVVVNPVPSPVVGSNSPVCLNNAINLNASGGTSYSWSGPNGFSSTTQNPTIAGSTAAMSGVYTVTVTSAGCTATGSVNVSVISPSTTASNTGPFCVGTTIQLNTNAALSYTWTGPGGFTSNLQNPTIPAATAAMAGTYNVLVSAGSCTAAASTNVVINPLPVPAATNTGPYCAGTTIQLNLGAFTTYSWSGPGGFTSNIQNPTISNSAVSNGGVYTVSVTNANGCVKTSTTNVVVNAVPIPIVGSNSPVCLNNAINLNASGGTLYSWNGPNGFTSANQNPVINGATTAMSGVYTVTVSAAGCSSTGSVNVSVISPTASASNTGPYCPGATIQLNTNAALSYTWNGPNGFTSNLQNPTINSASSVMTGVYSVTLSAGSCTATATTSVSLNPLPTPVIVSNDPICVGANLNLTGSGGVTYSWSGPNGFASTQQNPSITNVTLSNNGTYSLTVTDANGCSNSTSTLVTINAIPTPVATGGSACENGNVTLTASGGATYSWSGPNGFTSTQQNPVINNASLNAAGQYTVIVTAGGGCSGTAFTNVTITPAPIPTATVSGAVCENGSINFNAGGGTSYQWSGPNNFSSTLQSPNLTNVSAAQNGVYTVLVTDANGCSATATVSAVVNANPVGTILSGNVKGCSPVCANFAISSTPSATTANWSLGDGNNAVGVTTVNHCYSAVGVYTIGAMFIDQNGCTGSATSTVEVVPSPTADFNFAPIKPVINQDPLVTFTDASHNGNIVSWNWFFTNTAQSTSNQQNPTFMYTEPGIYAVALVVKSDIGCTDTIVKSIVVSEDYGIYVPNVFTPNGDGLNDVFQPKGFGIVKYELQIFDRWGERVFYTKNFEEGWDGKFQGRGGDICAEGSFTWLINVTNVFGKAHEIKGHVTLIK